MMIMESVIFDDSPLAEYLEGEGEGQSAWASTPTAEEPPSPVQSSFAPRGPSALPSKLRRRLQRPLPLKLRPNGIVAGIRGSCLRSLNSTIGRTENERFLEQFRYIIVASQLLNEHVNPTYYSPSTTDRPGSGGFGSVGIQGEIRVSLGGAITTALCAFALVWILHWVRGGGNSPLSKGRILLSLLLVAALSTILYAYARRRWLQSLRHQAVHWATALVGSNQSFDAVAFAAVSLIQEVELVSRGYRISSPLPPVTRLEEQGQVRRCARLRRTLRSCLEGLLQPYGDASGVLRSLAEERDLEKYFEVYEVHSADSRDMGSEGDDVRSDNDDSLKSLKSLLSRMQMLRRILLLSLLALDADGARPDYARWGLAVAEMRRLATATAECAELMNGALNEEERFVPSPSVKGPLSADRQRMRAQLRKVTFLSQGIRGLQAKMHVFREESNKTLDASEDISELGSNLISQYESIGADLRNLMQDWEDGKAALALNINKHERRISQQSLLSQSGPKSPSSPTLSLGGLTVIGGSPSDALKALNGEDENRSLTNRSRADASGSASDEEVFEAVALPRQRSALTREERIAKVQEDRARQAAAREKAVANTHMLRELETVIKLRPKTRTTGRVTSL